MGLSKSGDALLHVNTNFWGGTVKSKKTDRSDCLLLALRQSETRADALYAVSVIVNEIFTILSSQCYSGCSISCYE